MRRASGRRAWGLRTRVVLALALISLVTTGLLSAAAWALTNSYITHQRERVVVTQTTVDAALIRTTLRYRPSGLDTLLAGVGGSPETSVALRLADRWSVAGRAVPLSDIPADMVARAASGETVTRRLDAAGTPVLAAAVPVGSGSDVFVELAPLSELGSTLRFLATLLAAGTLLTVVAAAGLGIWTVHRALRPLDRLTEAAGRVARGDLDARLPERGAPDLADLALTFNATVDDVRRRVRRDARFAGDVSHELRSPLTTMVGAADVLRRRRGEMGEEAREAVDLLGTDVDRFAQMVNDLLEISRMDEPVDERDLGELVRAVAGRHAASVEVEVADDAPAVLGDRRRLDAVVTNLLANGGRHGGGIVAVSVDRVADRARVTVDDAGPGVPEELRAEIFERFQRGERAGRRQSGAGTGLGLALVSGHVRRHHGTVAVGDRPGGGARFVVELPGRPH